MVPVVKNLPASSGDARDTALALTPGSGRFPGGKWQPTPVFLPGKSHGQRSLVDYSSSGKNSLVLINVLNL